MRDGDAAIRIGDAMLWAWGECHRFGQIEAIMNASLQSVSDERSPKAPGSYSNPTLGRVIEAETQERKRTAKLATAMVVETEIREWRKDRHMKLWAKVAEAYYAAPYTRTGEEVASMLDISERTVKGIRSQMRRYLVMAMRRAQ